MSRFAGEKADSHSVEVLWVQIKVHEYKTAFRFNGKYKSFLCYLLKGGKAGPLISPGLHIYTKSVVFDIMSWNSSFLTFTVVF